MATTIKKISELEQITELSSSSNVIIEENGKAKRIAASNFAVGGSSEQVQADFSQNDPAQPDYVKNRTHWEVDGNAIFEWDGSTDGRDSVELGEGMTFYKVSDKTPGMSELVGTWITDNTGEMIQLSEDTMMEMDGVLSIGPMAIVTTVTELTMDETTINFPSTGVYFLMGGGNYVTAILDTPPVVHPLDEKFIPDTIARLEDISLDTIARKNKLFTNVVSSLDKVTNPPTSSWALIEDGGVIKRTYPSNFPVYWRCVQQKPFSNDDCVETEFLFDTIQPRSRSQCISNNSGLVEGEAYYLKVHPTNGTIKWYMCRAVRVNPSDNKIVIGNLAYYCSKNSIDAVYPDMGIPLYVECDLSGNSVYYMSVNDSEEKLVITVFQRSGVDTLDEMFIPDSIARNTNCSVPDAAGETVTAAEFNTLLTALRWAGILNAE